MNESGNNLLESGNVTNPRHFIYLDRNRLFSYTAQLSDGLPQLRRLLESVSQSNIDNPVEHYTEKVQESSNEAEGSLGSKGFVGSVGGKRNNKKIQKKSLKEGGSTAKFESLQTLSQDKAEHDNLYLVLEKDLVDAGLLHEVVKGSPFPKRPFQSTSFPGIVGQFNLQEFFQIFLGQVDFMVDPLAIYGTVI